ncbi:pullulanase [Paenibacillus sp. DMB20]|uniref:pullulanase n=1 Tax=Paenibacillus sp. DMB20 TaxID=1642570 RepID=UPI000627BE11|nr:pullulanase [Paenibacillus sp. DMB20]KKO54843.1 pullulanase [Paenibacillus sp. DMB20]
MRTAATSKRTWSIIIMISLVFSMLGIPPAEATASSGPSQVVLVGDLQSALGHGQDWDPAAAATAMTDLGNGEYRFTGVLPAGTYQYKVALNGSWDVSYGFDKYSNQNGINKGGNIQISLDEETEVTFYYNHKTLRIADSTYYTPIAADKLPRVIGSFQTEIGEAADWSPADAKLILQDPDYDHVYSVSADVYAGDHEYQIALGSETSGGVYPPERESLKLSQDVKVTFKYNAEDHGVAADYTVPADPTDLVPANHVRVHYYRTDGNYRSMGLWIFEDVASPSANWPSGATPFPDGQADGYGAFVDIPLKEAAQKVGIVVVDRMSGNKDGGDKKFSIVSPEMNEVWLKEGSDTVYAYEPVELPVDTVRIHYAREDRNYDSYGLWLWGDDIAVPSNGWPTGATMFPKGQVDRYGAYVDIPMKTNAQKINFLVLDPSKGDTGKDGGDKSFALLDRYRHLFVKQGDNAVYVSPYGEIPTGLVSAEVVAPGKLRLGYTMTDGLDAESLKTELHIRNKDDRDVAISGVDITGPATVEVTAGFTLDEVPLKVTYAGKTVSASTGWRMLDEMYYYDGDDLGAAYQAGGAELKLWAPTATSVTANVYDKDEASRLIGTAQLVKGDKGVWSVRLNPGDLGIQDFKGYFYQYEVTNNGATKKVLDPYAKSMAEFRVNTQGESGPDGDAVGKAAIVDLSGTDPSGFGFAEIPGYEKREDAVIWEIHVRDFTSDPSIENDLRNASWGSYNAFKEKLDYIKSLGVTHVQLLPVMAWYYGDEAAMKERELEYSAQNNEYNWGYDPHGYFSPDGAYSENPKDPELRIRELKAMIHAIHEADMGVILDVVYTHMAKADFLNDIVPNYYAFQDANGNFIGGFGNNLATNHKMAEKLMVDSVKYWFDEYKIDGMRFDMMGDATYDAVQNAYNAAAAINPKALFIGEGWRTFGGAAADPSLAGKGADQDWMDKTNDVGVFSDEFRNELKSGFGHEGEPRFITGGAQDIDTIFKNIKAQPGNTPADDPGDMVQYIEAHDNLPLYDIIAQSIRKDPSIPANDLEIHKRIRLGNLLTLTSQGTAFLHAGQEYGRTKQWLGPGVPEQKYHELKDETGKSFGYFIHDSYDSSDAINKFDWQKATNEAAYPQNNKTREYTSGLIKLRKSTDAFRLGDSSLVNKNVTLLQIPEVKAQDLVIAYKNEATDGTRYYVFVNADNKARTLTLNEDLSSGKVLADNDEAGMDGVKAQSGFTLTSNRMVIEPLTAVVIQMKAGQNGGNPGGETGGGTGGNPGSGTGGGTGGNPGTDPVNDPTVPSVPGQKIVNEEALRSGKDKVSVRLGAQEKEVLLPLQAGEILGSKPLEIQANGLVVQLPSSVLKALQKLVPAGQAKDAAISFKAEEIPSQAAASLMVKAEISEKAKLKLGSKMFALNLSVKTKDGREYKLERFAVPVTLEWETNAGINGKFAGIYHFSDPGRMDYAGGKQDNARLTAAVRHFGKYAVLEYDKSFADLTGHWVETAVKELAAKHVVNGTGDIKFSPGLKLTRAQFAAMLVRALELNDQGDAAFKDVDDKAWYASVVAAAAHHGLVSGKNKDTFAPNAAITREEMAVMLVRAYRLKGGEASSAGPEPAVTGKEQVSPWAVKEVNEAAALGLMKGQGKGRFMPKEVATRAESAQAVLNLMNKLGAE